VDGSAPEVPVAPAPNAPAVDTVPGLAQLTVSDQRPPSGFRRDEWPSWRDIDGDGCDAREQALIAASTPPAVTAKGCEVVSGTWVSAYDGRPTNDPGDVDIDHVVPLANAFASGGDRWSTDQRVQYANDQRDLWAVSASANRSKGDRAPDQWRPPRHEVWCEYARRWIAIKVRWSLTATTTERDALGQMLETC
jgi:hypothetical protein